MTYCRIMGIVVRYVGERIVRCATACIFVGW